MRVVVGVPMLASSGGLSFWVDLCGARGVPGVEQELERFRVAEAAGPAAFQDFLRSYHVDLMRKVCPWAGLFEVPVYSSF